MTNRDWNEVLQDVKSAIESGECASIRQLANAVGVPKSTFQGWIQREYGVTIYEDLETMLYDDVSEQEFMQNEEIEEIANADSTKITQLNYENLRVVVFGDIHAPFQDDRAIAVAAAIIADYQPDECVCIGDSVDFYAVSPFDRNPKRVLRLQEELDMAFAAHKYLTEASPESRWYMLDANHEMRWKKYLNAHPELISLRALELPGLLRFDELGWQYGGSERWYCDGNLAVTHGVRYSKHSGWAVKAELSDRFFDQNIVQGHNHKVGHYSTRSPIRQMSGYEIGCLCSLSPSWEAHANWNHGIMLIDIVDGIPFFNNVMFHTNSYFVKAIVGGKLYEA